ncbi:MAG: transposase [Planctomycetota bacterium]|jgi:putative transposase
MPRAKRLVVPGLPHHVTQRGVRSTDVFRDDVDRELYLSLMRQHAEPKGVRFLAWCLMTNHVHLVVVPEREDSLARGIGDAHRRYTRARNFREGVRGYLFQGRFWSSVLDERHLLASVRYTELNPVAAGIVADPARYEWSSAAYHLGRERADPLVVDRTLLGLVDNWAEFLQDGMDEIEARELERALSTGRPVGSAAFVEGLERRYGRRLTAGRPGRPRKRRGEGR